MQEIAVTDHDLTAINQFTQKEMTADEVFIFGARFIDDQPTGNGRVWTREWQEAAVDRHLFDGIPFLTNHENDQSKKIGTVFSAEMKEDGIHGRVFIPLDQQGKDSREAIENGRIRNVSINASGEMKKQGDNMRVLPSDDMRVFEVSAVGVGGCKDCHVTEDIQPGSDSCETTEPSRQADSLSAFGRRRLDYLVSEYVRFTGFVLGESIQLDRDAYRKVAQATDPFTLEKMVNDLRKSYSEKHETSADELADVQSEVNKECNVVRRALREHKESSAI